MRLVAILPAALILAGAAPVTASADEAADQAIDRIVTGEQQFLAQMHGQKPFVETYVQELNPAGDAPVRDDYSLMRLDLAQKTGEVTLTESRSFKRPLLPYIYAGPGMRFHPEGFVRMVFVDLQDFNRQTYRFEYVRREFLGDVRCMVFQVSPRDTHGDSRFLGSIWVEDAGYRIVRFNGVFTHSTRWNVKLHFDSWRVNAAAGLWVPAYIYVEEGGDPPSEAEKLHLKARVMFWGYQSRSSRTDELSNIQIESGAVDRAGAAADPLPLESERAWEQEAEQNVLDKLERSGLLAPKGEADQVLDTVVNNLEATSHIAQDVHCRVLLTTPMETFSIYHTIVISRGLLDVLPDEASLAMVLSEELANIALAHKTPTAFAFGDATMFDDRRILDKLKVARTHAEMDEDGKKALEILSDSPYAGKLANAGLFLKAIDGRTETLSNLVCAHLGDQFASKENLSRLQALEENAPPLEEGKIDQIAALPLGSRVKLNPWTDRIGLMKTEQLALSSAREKMPFEITPDILRLTRADQADAPVSARIEVSQ
jgi:hypothetical protein